MNKGIVFDFDGVIINSHEVQMRALETAYRAVIGEGDIPYDGFFRLSGDSLENIFTFLGFPLKMLSIYRDYSKHNVSLIKMHDGFFEILQEVKSKNCFAILCTGKERLRTCDILKNLSIEHYFDAIICSDDVKRPKPHPESIYIAMDRYKIKRENMIMIGDGINDIKCAQKAGIESVGVLWGDTSPQELISEGPDVIVNNTLELKYLVNYWILNGAFAPNMKANLLINNRLNC